MLYKAVDVEPNEPSTMRLKNLEHLSFLKIQQEIITTIHEAGMPALFNNVINDIQQITQQNEYLNHFIRVLWIGASPKTALPAIFGSAESIDTNALDHGETLTYHYKKDDFEGRMTLAKLEFAQLGMLTAEQPLLTVVCCNTASPEVEMLRLFISDLPWVIMVPISHSLPSDLEKEFSKSIVHFESIPIDSFLQNENSLWNVFEQTDSTKKSYYQNLLSISQLKKVCQTIDFIISKESNSIISKKSISQQKLKLIPDTRSQNSGELLNKIKQMGQQYSSNFEKGIIAKTELFTQSPQADLKKVITDFQAKVEFHEEIKSKNIELTLGASYQNDLLTHIQAMIHSKCHSDLNIFADTLHLFEKEIEALCEENGIVFQRPNLKYLTPNEVDYFISQTLSKKIDYSGSAPNKGLYEYFSAARKFQMVFFMMASVFGVSGVIRQYQYISIPLSIVLLGYGIISVSKTVTKEREENQETELKSASEAIDKWIKDVGTDLNRNWIKTLTDAFKNQIQTLTIETESIVKTVLTSKANESDEERKKQQKTIQLFDQNERKLESVNRNIQNLDRSMSRFITDTKSSIHQLSRNQRDVKRVVTSDRISDTTSTESSNLERERAREERERARAERERNRELKEKSNSSSDKGMNTEEGITDTHSEQ
jgi:hypothetical protein